MSNEGQTGVQSIRFCGMTVDQLPIAENAIIRQQMPDIIKADRQNTIVNIKAKYPKQSVAWIDGAIRECEDTIRNVRKLKDSQQKMISDYTGLISLCKHRDNELKKTTSEKEIKQIKTKFPPYNVKAMKVQIQLSNDAIFRSDDVVDKEHKSISELRELRVECVNRDNELKKLGAKIG